MMHNSPLPDASKRAKFRCPTCRHRIKGDRPLHLPPGAGTPELSELQSHHTRLLVATVVLNAIVLVLVAARWCD